MHAFMRRSLLLAAIAGTALAAAAPTAAHNRGHVILPSGECLEVGSGEEGPSVPAQNPNRNDVGQLDLVPGAFPDTGDQYGARFAAERSPAILPGGCP
jgi:hypothetical protein